MIPYRGLFWRVKNFRIWVENVYEKYWRFFYFFFILADTTVMKINLGGCWTKCGKERTEQVINGFDLKEK